MRAILFDKDGTLLDFQASWSRAYRDLSLDLCDGDARAANAMLVAGGMHPESGKFRSGSVLAAGNTIDIATFWFPHLPEPELRIMIARMDAAFYENGIRYSVPVPGLADTLAALSDAGFAMGVATSDRTAATRAAIGALRIGGYLPHVFGYDSVARPKPAPDIVYAFASAVGLPPNEIAVVGDNPHDLEMARSAGAGAAVGVLSGNSSAAELMPLADAVLDSVCALPDWLRSRR